MPIPLKQIGQPVDVAIQDQHTQSLGLFFNQAIGIPTTLTAGTAIDDGVISVASVANISVGNYLGIFAGVSDGGRFYFGEVLAINALDVTLDSPLDNDFDIGDVVVSTTRELAVDGSVTPEVFAVQAGTVLSPLTLDITRIIIKIITTNPPEFADFGDISGGLLKGVVLRRVDGITRNLWNLKTNGEMANYTYDISFYDQSKQQGVNGIVSRLTYAGPSKHGVTIRLEPGDRLELIVQDNLSSILSFRIIAQGHVVE